jgi:hypothetical protein
MAKLNQRKNKVKDLSNTINPDNIEKFFADEFNVEIGQWYWVEDDEGESRRKDDPIEAPEGKAQLMCVTEIGSNYIRLDEPTSERHSVYTRIHIDNFQEETTYEPNAEAIVQQNIAHHQNRVQGHLNHIKKVTKKLGVSPKRLSSSKDVGEKSGTDLAIMSSTKDLANYKKQLINAKKNLLPKLFDRVKKDNEILTKWMSAEAVSLEAHVKTLQGSIDGVKDRIFNVSLYAGLTEHAVTVKEGKPAAYKEKINLFQRMMYMDEECLMNYQSGGMEFKNIAAFDKWMGKPENYERILPFPRCVVVFRVRRNEKHRAVNNIMDVFINLRLKNADKFTYMYIRNGEKLSRLTLEDFEFGEKLFPDEGSFDLSEPMMAKVEWRDEVTLISVREFEAITTKQAQKQKEYDQWFADNPYFQWTQRRFYKSLWEVASDPEKFESGSFYVGMGAIGKIEKIVETMCEDNDEEYDEGHEEYNGDNYYYTHDNPIETVRFNGSAYEKFDDDNLDFDSILKDVQGRIKKFNRMSLILQGLLDRSDVFHPHAPAKTWTQEGFDEILNLIYDGSNVLHHGDKPDVQAYIDKRNEQATKDSVFYGQQDLWELHEGNKENDRRDRHPYRDYDHVERWTPDGNDGPTLVARPNKISKTRKVTFAWSREITSWRSDSHGELRRTTFTAPIHKLFNMSAYKAGDYKQFFNDPRTRQEYLKWAPMLLTAEDFLAGKCEVLEPYNP